MQTRHVKDREGDRDKKITTQAQEGDLEGDNN